MSVFIVSDLHLFHTKIMDMEPIRLKLGKNLDDMAEGIIERWNSVVGPNDIVWNLGDVAFAVGTNIDKIENIQKRLNGIKYLIKGNHDRYVKSRHLERYGFERILDGPFWLMDSEIVLSHEPIFGLPPAFKNYHGHLHSKGHHTEFEGLSNLDSYINCSIEVLEEMKPMKINL